MDEPLTNAERAAQHRQDLREGVDPLTIRAALRQLADCLVDAGWMPMDETDSNRAISRAVSRLIAQLVADPKKFPRPSHSVTLTGFLAPIGCHDSDEIDRRDHCRGKAR